MRHGLVSVLMIESVYTAKSRSPLFVGILRVWSVPCWALIRKNARYRLKRLIHFQFSLSAWCPLITILRGSRRFTRRLLKHKT